MHNEGLRSALKTLIDNLWRKAKAARFILPAAMGQRRLQNPWRGLCHADFCQNLQSCAMNSLCICIGQRCVWARDLRPAYHACVFALFSAPGRALTSPTCAAWWGVSHSLFCKVRCSLFVMRYVNAPLNDCQSRFGDHQSTKLGPDENHRFLNFVIALPSPLILKFGQVWCIFTESNSVVRASLAGCACLKQRRASHSR